MENLSKEDLFIIYLVLTDRFYANEFYYNKEEKGKLIKKRLTDILYKVANLLNDPLFYEISRNKK